MKVLHLSTSDIDNGGARAAYRLHSGLQLIGCDSQMLVRAKFGTDDSVIADRSVLTKLSPPISGLPLKLHPRQNATMFATQWFPDVFASRVRHIRPDVINLHWICNGFLQIETLKKFKVPLVWTLHDMWPFTGGCDYTRDCQKYQQSCGACPQLGSDRSWDLSRWVLNRKAHAWKGVDLTLVATSSWMADCARSSSLFRDRRIEVIPLGLDTSKYRPINQQVARELLGLPQDKQLILFGAVNATSDRRKGFQLLLPALQKVSTHGWKDQIELIIFGSSKPNNPIDLGFNSHYLGYVRDDLMLALIYSAADVMVVPSIQEAFGQTASESLACGTPVVAFDGTGVRDIVDHQQNGYLAQPFEVEELAKGIVWVLEDNERHQKLKSHAREKSLREFSLEVQSQRYLSLYEELISKYASILSSA